MGLLIALRAGFVRLELDAEGLQIDAPVGTLTPAMREAIQRHKDALTLLPRPFVNARGELIMPLYAPPQYHWQPIEDTLRELNAFPETRRLHGRPLPLGEREGEGGADLIEKAAEMVENAFENVEFNPKYAINRRKNGQNVPNSNHD